jgi:Tol biopolymer transport system component
MRKIFLAITMFSYVSLNTAQNIKFIGKPELVFPHLVSTEKSEIKLTFSPDGTRMLWGAIGWNNGVGGWDIWESVKEKNEWSVPKPVSFNSTSNDFDPCFSFDGKGVYFFSNREGSYGGDDIYFTPFDKQTKTYGSAINFGENINSKGDEWGPVISEDGKTLMFCTDGRGGLGKHDIFISELENGKWQSPKNLGTDINSPLDDFDPVFLSDGKSIVFASERGGVDNVDLYVAEWKNDHYAKPVVLDSAINSKDYWDFGCSVNPQEKNVLYFNSHNPDNGVGKVDVYKIKYVIQ